MHQDAQQHNWIPTKTIILAQQAKEASTWSHQPDWKYYSLGIHERVFP